MATFNMFPVHSFALVLIYSIMVRNHQADEDDDFMESPPRNDAAGAKKDGDEVPFLFLFFVFMRVHSFYHGILLSG